MISGNGKIVSGLIHDLHQVLALGQSPHRRALDGVPGIHQGHIRSLLLHLVFIPDKSGVAHVFLDAAMGIVGVEDHHIVIQGKGRLAREGRHKSGC